MGEVREQAVLPHRRRGNFIRLSVSCIAAAASLYSAGARGDVTATWGGASGNWTDPTQWSTNPNYPNNGSPSGVDYDVAISSAGSGAYTVELDSAVAVDSVAIGAANATLTDQGTLTTSSLNISSGTFDLNGSLVSAAITQTGGTFTASYATLQNASLASNLTIANQDSPLNIDDGITLNGNTLTLSGPDALMLFALNGSSYSLSNGTIDLATGQNSLGSDSTAGSALVLSNSAIVEGSGYLGYDFVFGIATPTLTNAGTVLANVNAETLTLQPSSLINDGTLEATAGGKLSVQATTWNNTGGTIQANANSVVILAGATSTGDLGTLVNNGTIMLEATVNNAGQTFNFGGATGTWEIDGATINNGTVNIASTTQLVGATLNDVTLGSNLTLNQQGAVDITNGIDTTGQTIFLTNTYAVLSFQLNGSSYTLNNLTVDLQGTDASLDTDTKTGTSLTIGATTTINGYGNVGAASGAGNTPTLINAGLIQGSGGALTISPDSFVNNGTVEATSGSTVYVEPVNSLNNSDGTLQADAGGTLYIEDLTDPNTLGSLVNNGTMELIASNVQNAGKTLSFGTTSTGSWYVNSMSVSGGTINFPMAIVYNAEFYGVTLGSNLNVASLVQIENGLIANGYSINLASGAATLEYVLNGSAYLASGMQITLGGSIVGAPAGGGTLETDSTPGSTLTLDSKSTVQGYGYITGQTLINQGEIAANSKSNTLAIEPVSFSNAGTLEALDGGILAIAMSSAWTNNGILDIDSLSKITDSHNLTFATGSAYDDTLAAGGKCGILQVTGNLNLSADPSLFISTADPSGSYEIVSYTGTLSGTFGQVTPGFEVSYSTPGEILVTAVPEPASIAWVGMLGGGLLALGRRHRRARL